MYQDEVALQMCRLRSMVGDFGGKIVSGGIISDTQMSPRTRPLVASYLRIFGVLMRIETERPQIYDAKRCAVTRS